MVVTEYFPGFVDRDEVRKTSIEKLRDALTVSWILEKAAGRELVIQEDQTVSYVMCDGRVLALIEMRN